MLYIFDIDGVLADVTHLLPLIQSENKDFDAYYSRIGEALPIAQGCELLRAITMCAWTQQTHPHGDIYFVTGRSELSRETTIEWLQKHGYAGERPNLHMRGNTDRRYAQDVKRGMTRTVRGCTGNLVAMCATLSMRKHGVKAEIPPLLEGICTVANHVSSASMVL
jgi:hypothetical protein